MRILQVLPELNSGGVERGTLDLARELVQRGHESLVISNGGRLVETLEQQGSRHIQRPVHRKSPASLAQIHPMRRLLRELAPDVVHVRSRLPAWIVWLAWRGLPVSNRPRLVSTFHGLYSVNRYSAIMARAERIIAVSHCVAEYIETNYAVAPSRIRVIPRGVDTSEFHPAEADPDWRNALYREFPQLRDKQLVLMPGRLSRWKGQEAFLELMQRLVQTHPQCHGVLLGDADPGKAHYEHELRQKAKALGVDGQVTFAGHRSDIAGFYRLADLVCHLSSKPEPFGRTLTEALACGAPVVAYNRGGAAESLQSCFAEGLVPPDDLEAFQEKAQQFLGRRPTVGALDPRYTLSHQVAATLEAYQQ